MTISRLQRLTVQPLWLISAAALFLAACDQNPVRPTPGNASFDGQPGNVGKAAKSGVISAYVLVNKAGVAVVNVRTGTFNLVTGIGTPNGVLTKVQYKIYDGNAKPKDPDGLGKNVYGDNDKVVNTSSYADTLPAGTIPTWPPAVTLRYRLVVQANLRNVNCTPDPNDKDVDCDGKGNAVVRFVGPVYYNPDADVVISIGGQVDPKPIKKMIVTPGVYDNKPTEVTAVKQQTWEQYGLTISNTGPIQTYFDSTQNTTVTQPHSSVGVQVDCHVTVNDQEVAPDHIKYYYINGPTQADSASGSQTYIKPDSARICRFALMIADTGMYKVSVNASALSPSDYDPTNNTVSQMVHIVDYDVIDGGPNVGGQVAETRVYDGNHSFLGVSSQSATISSLTLLETDQTVGDGTYSLHVQMKTAGQVLNEAILDNVTLQAGIGGTDYCVASNNLQGATFTPITVTNGRTPTLTVCAHFEAAGKQQVNIDYNYSAGPLLLGANPLLFGDNFTWSVFLTRTQSSGTTKYGNVTTTCITPATPPQYNPWIFDPNGPFPTGAFRFQRSDVICP